MIDPNTLKPGPELDRAVARAIGMTVRPTHRDADPGEWHFNEGTGAIEAQVELQVADGMRLMAVQKWSPSTDPSLLGELIERYKIGLLPPDASPYGLWMARIGCHPDIPDGTGETAAIAVCRAIVKHLPPSNIQQKGTGEPGRN